MAIMDLNKAELDVLVALAEEQDWLHVEPRSCKVLDWRDNPPRQYRPSSDWRDGGPIIEREDIVVEPRVGYYRASKISVMMRLIDCQAEGGTYLEAAMRCYVASRFGGDLLCRV